MLKVKFDDTLNKWVILKDGNRINTYLSKEAAIIDCKNLSLELGSMLEVEERKIKVEIIKNYKR